MTTIPVVTNVMPTHELKLSTEVHKQRLRITGYVYNCPNCNEEQTGLGDRNQNASYGPWGCDSCGYHYKIEVKAGEVHLTQVDKFRDVNHYWSLLGLRSNPKVLIINRDVCPPEIKTGKPIDLAEYNEQMAYYFNEQTCPTNFLRGIQYIVEDDDWDAHGVFQHIQSIRSEEFTNFVKAHEHFYPDGREVLLNFFPKLADWDAGLMTDDFHHHEEGDNSWETKYVE